MTESSSALHTALACYQAWTSHDFDRAMTFIAEDIVCHAPAARLDGAGAFRAFMEPFTQIVTRSALIAAFGDDTTATPTPTPTPSRCPTPRGPSASPSSTARSPRSGSSSTGPRSPPRARRRERDLIVKVSAQAGLQRDSSPRWCVA